jgi:hypothetical protein
MEDRELVSIITAMRRDSLGYESGDLSQERASAMDHYHGRPYGNEMEGRSAVVSRDLAETVDWALPAIMRVFVQSGNLAEFTPEGPEDEQLAQQETDYVNQVIMKDNPGFMILHDAIKDTMLLKNGYVKHWWDVEEKISEEGYTGLTMEQVVKLIQDLEYGDAEVEVKGQESRLVDVGGTQVELFDLKLQIKKKCGKVKVMAVPSEEVRVSKRCRGSLQESPFTEHVTRKFRSELIEMGMDRDFVESLPAYGSQEGENSSERNARDSVTDETDNDSAQGTLDRSMDEIEYCEAYLKVDYDGDGIAELRKVVTCANRIPPGDEWNEAIPAVSMTGFVMKRVPHRHVGESLDDEIADLQEIKTTLQRQLLDNVYRVNDSEIVVNEDANLRDFMTRTPGGVKRTKGSMPVGNAFQQLVTPPIVDKLLPAIDYIDKVKEIRSGIRPGSDLDPDMLQDVTKGAFLEGMNRLSQKIEMIARMLAESGVKDMVQQVHGLLVRNQNQQRLVQMRGKWVPVNPSEWRERTDLTVKVGLGTGNEEQKRQNTMLLGQGQAQLMQAVMAAPPPVYAKMYAWFEDMAKSLGFDVPDKYALAPNSQEYMQLQQSKPQQPSDPAVIKAQIDAQVKMQTEQMRAQMQAEVDRNRQQAEMQQQAARMQMERELAQFQATLQAQIERERALIQQETQALIARINAEAKLDAAQITSQTTLSAQQESASDGAVDA